MTSGRCRFGRLCLGAPGAVAVFVVVSGFGQRAAHAQVNEVAFSVERFVPAPGIGQFWTSQDASVLPHLGVSVGLTTSVMSKPILLRDLINDNRISAPVRTRLGVDVLAAIGIRGRFQLGVAIPFVAFQTGDRLKGIDLDETELATTTLSDMRVHTKLRLINSDGFGIALAAHLSLPTGAEDQFAGEKSAVFQWLLIASHRTSSWAIALNMGRRLRREQIVLLSPARPHGDELVGALAGEAVLYQGLSGVAELAFVRGDTGPAPDVRGPSPVEFRGGLRLRVTPELSVGGGLGWGISPSEVGSPAWRVFAGVSWASTMERLAPRRR